jgi:hypothetical protein
MASTAASGHSVPIRLHVLSDVHRDLSGEVNIPAVDADVVVLAGDVEKHARFRAMAAGSRVTLLENDVWEHRGMRFLGCTLWAPATQRMRVALKNSVAWLREMLARPYAGSTVVITHHAPLHQSLPLEVLIDDAAAKRLAVDLRDLIEPSNIAL